MESSKAWRLADKDCRVLQIVSDDRCRWDPETWDVMVRDYGLRANDYSNANTRTLQGLKAGRKPTIGQTYAATLLRQQAHTVGGGLLSDEPGLGKVRPKILARAHSITHGAR
jgi:hypothetical protein